MHNYVFVPLGHGFPGASRLCTRDAPGFYGGGRRRRTAAAKLASPALTKRDITAEIFQH